MANVGEAPDGPRAFREPGPLRDVRVLDLSSVGPASRCSRLLSDFGAEVIKVQPIGSDDLQIAPPSFSYSAHRFMKRVKVNLKDQDGKAAFMELASTADVIIESFRPGVVDRLGIGYGDIKAVRPKIIYCSTTGYGQSGPHATWAGHDIDYLAVSGYLAMSEPSASGSPPLPGASLGDAAGGGMHAALSIMAALVEGRGAHLDVAVSEGVLWLMSLSIDEHLATGKTIGFRHDILSGRYACYGLYQTKDKGWLAVGAIEEKFFKNLCVALDCSQWIRSQHDDLVQTQIRDDFKAAFLARDRSTWVDLLAGSNTCVAPVLSIAEVVGDHQVKARNNVIGAESSDGLSFRQLAPLLAGMQRPNEPVLVPDHRETSTIALLEEANVSPRTIDSWRAKGVIA